MTQDTSEAMAALTVGGTPRVLDIDLEGRVLLRTPSSPHQLLEIGRKGQPRILTLLESDCTGRYIPGHRTIVVEHDWGAKTARQLSLLNMVATQIPAGLDGFHLLAHGAGISHRLLHVHHDGVTYLAHHERRGTCGLYFRHWMTGVHPLDAAAPLDYQATTATDGQTVFAFSPSTGRAAFYRVDSEEATPIDLDSSDTPTSARLTPDGTRVAVTFKQADGSQVARWYGIDGPTACPQRRDVVPGCFSPDAAHMLTFDRAGRRIVMMALDGDELFSVPCLRLGATAHAEWNIAGDMCAIDSGAVGAWRLRLADGAVMSLW
ncbi:hypothetical protein BSZ39_02645 [Bowdeniella nasicola]|uniref:WD40-like Beta Propeller Repeat n=1 Tax=Bowdeniella nasicola TaxID=208480 RepID=A0A1Q5Q4I6_9ACTO|nr:hypothetical protein [Bowdeniella nasicola]OKL54703.1 hypothetical protein BSZ39_02645 [Bowdeniella nasicola]